VARVNGDRRGGYGRAERRVVPPGPRLHPAGRTIVRHDPDYRASPCGAPSRSIGAPGDNSAAILAAILAAFPDATIEIVPGPLDDDHAVEVRRPLSHLDASQAVRKRRGDFSPVGSAAEP
jgi:hypothetical protein